MRLVVSILVWLAVCCPADGQRWYGKARPIVQSRQAAAAQPASASAALMAGIAAYWVLSDSQPPVDNNSGQVILTTK